MNRVLYLGNAVIIVIKLFNLPLIYTMLVINTYVVIHWQAFLIAFTSEFLPKLLYEYTVSPDMSLKGFVNYTLAWAPNGTLSEPCR